MWVKEENKVEQPTLTNNIPPLYALSMRMARIPTLLGVECPAL
jgi:hypothetical protein